MKLIAKKSLRYAGRSLSAGDEFEASDKDAKLLKAIRKAAEAVENDEPSPTVITIDTKDDEPKNKYRTRRLKAEDSSED